MSFLKLQTINLIIKINHQEIVRPPTMPKVRSYKSGHTMVFTNVKLSKTLWVGSHWGDPLGVVLLL